MMRSSFPKRGLLCLALAASLLSPAIALSADEDLHGWRRSGTGFWGEEPEVHAGISDNGIALEMTLPPGTGVSYSREGSWTSDNAAIRISTDNVAPGKNEYRPEEAEFPASVTFVYGKDALPISSWGRFKLFFRQLRNGFRPSGIRLTYAWGARLPVGSMYRLWDEETVFLLAGREEAGKEISSARQLKSDFQAAYGRSPKGPVTRVLVEARRPTKAKGPANTSITVRFPAD